MRRALTALTSLTLVALCLSSAFAADIDYEFNSKGQLIRAVFSDGTIVIYDYDENGNRRSTSTSGKDVKAPTVPGSVVATVISSTQIDLTWAASTDGGSSTLAGYKVERCEGWGCVNFALVQTLTTSPYQNTGLAADRNYRYRLRAYDTAGNHSDYSAVVSAWTRPDTIPPTVPGTLTATAQSSTRIDVSWGAATDSGGSGLAGYRIERCQGAGCTAFTLSHYQSGTSFRDTGLVANATYRYRVKSYDNALLFSTAYTNEASATTSLDTIAPAAATNLIAAASSATRIDLSWNAPIDEGGSGLAGYHVERCSGAGCTTFTQIATHPSSNYADTAVTANTTYSYRVRAFDHAANVSTTYSNVASATTPQDATRPAIPGTLTATAAASSQINLSWGGSTDSGGNLAGYRIERCQNADCTSFSLLTTVLVSNPDGRTYSDSNVASTTTYLYRVSAYDGVGNVSEGYSPTASATTPADTTAPSAPTVSVVAVAPQELNVTWTASTDSGGAGLAGYKLERCQNAGCTNFVQVGTFGVSTRIAYHRNLPPSSTYVYRVRAYDNASPANHSVYSPVATGTTLADTEAPSAPSGLRATASSGSQVDLSWTGSSDYGGSSFAGYEIERCQGIGCTSFALITTTRSTPFQNTGLTDATTYSYRVRAYDGATPPNRSSYSNIATVTTPDTTPPDAPRDISFEAITATSATAVWGAASDNVSVTGYRYRVFPGDWRELPKITSVSLTGLTCATSYSVYMQARDAAGLWGATSVGSFTTLDDCPPSPPGTPSISNITTNSADASWARATDNYGVAGYRYRLGNGAWRDVGNVTSTTVTGLAMGTTYIFQVQARDYTGSWGGISSNSFTTQSTPPPPTGLTRSHVADCSWAASWNPSPGATSYLFRSTTSTPPNEWPVTGTSTSVSCPLGQPDANRPKSVRACNVWGCGLEADFP